MKTLTRIRKVAAVIGLILGISISNIEDAQRSDIYLGLFIVIMSILLVLPYNLNSESHG